MKHNKHRVWPAGLFLVCAVCAVVVPGCERGEATNSGAPATVASDTRVTNGPQPAAPQGVITAVKIYDPARDPAVDLADAMSAAKSSGKRILIQVGGNWCPWCYRMHQYFADHPAVAKALDDGFVLILVNFSDENKNQDFLKQYPAVRGYPHLFVLESDGTLLKSQDTSELEEGDSYNEENVLGFLSLWTK